MQKVARAHHDPWNEILVVVCHYGLKRELVGYELIHVLTRIHDDGYNTNQDDCKEEG